MLPWRGMEGSPTPAHCAFAARSARGFSRALEDIPPNAVWDRARAPYRQRLLLRSRYKAARALPAPRATLSPSAHRRSCRQCRLSERRERPDLEVTAAAAWPRTRGLSAIPLEELEVGGHLQRRRRQVDVAEVSLERFPDRIIARQLLGIEIDRQENFSLCAHVRSRLRIDPVGDRMAG